MLYRFFRLCVGEYIYFFLLINLLIKLILFYDKYLSLFESSYIVGLFYWIVILSINGDFLFYIEYGVIVFLVLFFEVFDDLVCLVVGEEVFYVIEIDGFCVGCVIYIGCIFMVFSFFFFDIWCFIFGIGIFFYYLVDYVCYVFVG